MVLISAAVRVLAINGRRSCNSRVLTRCCVFCRTLSSTTHTQRSALLPTKPNRMAKPSFDIIFRHLSSGPGVIQFNLSDIGEGIREVEVKEWFVKIGQKVAQFDSICEVQSDKAAVTITSRYDGVIKKLYYEVGSKALVGKPLVDIEITGGATADQTAAPVEQIAKKAEPSTQQVAPKVDSPKPAPVVEEEENKDILATPAVRRFAKEKNILLAKVKGTGKGGRILKEDILAFANGSAKAPPVVAAHVPPPPSVKAPGDRVESLNTIQKAMFKSMTSALSIPHFGYRDEYDATELVALRKKVNSTTAKNKGAVKVTFMPFFLKAASLSLHKYPLLNAAVDTSGPEPKLVYRSAHNIGVAMDTPDGLIVPNVKNCERLSILEIAAELQRLQAAAAVGKLTLSDLTGGTFTLSNIGSVGGTYAHPVLPPLQVCIGAIGKIARVARIVNEPDPRDPKREVETIKPANVVYFSWSADHRVIDGATVARFSNAIKAYVEQPALMTLDMK